jgi:hypothetical protein
VTVALTAPSASVASSSAVLHSLLEAPAEETTLAHGVVVDLRRRRAVRTLLTDDVWSEVSDGSRAYEHVDKETFPRERRSGPLRSIGAS